MSPDRGIRLELSQEVRHGNNPRAAATLAARAAIQDQSRGLRVVAAESVQPPQVLVPNRPGSSTDTCRQYGGRSQQRFKRDADDLYCDLPVPFTTLALGGSVRVPTIDV